MSKTITAVFGNGIFTTTNYVTYECSVCGKIALWVRGMKSLYPSDNCPHCGADMVSKRTAIAE